MKKYWSYWHIISLVMWALCKEIQKKLTLLTVVSNKISLTKSNQTEPIHAVSCPHQSTQNLSLFSSAR